ncbi:MAG: hypothetical protein ACKOQ6_01270, partial [Bacteroidota bacterium]
CWLFSRKSSDSVSKIDESWTNHYSQNKADGKARVIDGITVAYVDSTSEFLSGIQDSVIQDSDFRVFTAAVGYNCTDRTGGQMLVFEVISGDEKLEWYGVRLNDYNLRPGSWQMVHLARPMPEAKGPVKIKCYIWNKDHRAFYVDKLSAKLEKAHDPYSRK